MNKKVKDLTNMKRPNQKHVDALKKAKNDMRNLLEEHLNNKPTKQDEPMDETAASSFSPPPQPPGAPRISRDRSRSRQPDPTIKEAKKEPPIILKPSDEEEIKNSQPGRPKPSDEPKRRGRSVEVRPATSGIRKEEVKPEPEKIKAIEDKKEEQRRDRSRSKPRGEPVRKNKSRKIRCSSRSKNSS